MESELRISTHHAELSDRTRELIEKDQVLGTTGETVDGYTSRVRVNDDGDALWIADLSVSADGMINDLHGTGAYRAHLVKVLTGRAVAAA